MLSERIGMVALAFTLGACGASNARPSAAAHERASVGAQAPRPSVEGHDAERADARDADRADVPPAAAEPPAWESAPAPEHPTVLPLRGWFGVAWTHYDWDIAYEELRWDESASAQIVFDGHPYGVPDQFELTARFALAGSDSPARLDITVVACDDRASRGPGVETTQSFGYPLRWRDVTEEVIARGRICEPDGPIVRCPPATPRAYAATHCSHTLCVKLKLYDRVAPSESALLAVVGRGRFRWVSDRPVDRCPWL